MNYHITIDGVNYEVALEKATGFWRCQLNGQTLIVDAVLARKDVLSLIIDGKAYEIKRERTPTDTHLWVRSRRYAAEIRDPRSLRSQRQAAGDDQGPQRLVARMPGKVVRILVREKAAVEAGQGIVVVEAMKMQNEIKSPKKGTLQKLIVAEGAAVNAGDVLAIVE